MMGRMVHALLVGVLAWLVALVVLVLLSYVITTPLNYGNIAVVIGVLVALVDFLQPNMLRM